MLQLIGSWKHKSRTLSNRGSKCIEFSNISNSYTKKSGSPRKNFSRNFPISCRHSTQWGSFLPKWGVLIQVDIGGHIDLGGYCWPPTYSTWIHAIVSFGFLVSLHVGKFTIFGSFSGPKLLKLFWVPKWCFWQKRGPTWLCHQSLPLGSCITQIYLSSEVFFMSNRDRMRNLWPPQFDVPIYPNRAYSLALHLLGLDF